MADCSVSLDDKVLKQIQMIRKIRKLPLPGEVVVNKGDKVQPDTMVAKIVLRPGIPWVIPAARLLGVESNELSKCLIKKVGDRVKVKEVIGVAEQGLYGRKELVAPTDGLIEGISDRSGRVTIREEFGKEDPPVSFDAAYELGCKPEELSKHMLRTVGHEVKKGQMVLRKVKHKRFSPKPPLPRFRA